MIYIKEIKNSMYYVLYTYQFIKLEYISISFLLYYHNYYYIFLIIKHVYYPIFLNIFMSFIIIYLT